VIMNGNEQKPTLFVCRETARNEHKAIIIDFEKVA
jgi:hypothetical protein